MKLYHNPKCSKSRATLALLEEKNADFEIVEYLKEPPTNSELSNICKALGMEAKQLVRNKEDLFKELNLSLDSDMSDDEWINTMAQNPKLIERPILVNGNKAAIGRPPENVLEII